MNHSYTFEYLDLVLRPLVSKDLEELRLLRNKYSRFFLNQSHISPSDQLKWYDNYLQKNDDIMFTVAKKDNPDKFIGAISAYHINFENSVCEIGRTMVDKIKAPERGIGTNVTKAICYFCFRFLKLKKVICVCLKNNLRILRVNQKIGFSIIDDTDDSSYVLELTSKEFCKNNLAAHQIGVEA